MASRLEQASSLREALHELAEWFAQRMLCLDTVVVPLEMYTKINGEIAAGTLRNRGGATVETDIAEALLREDGKILYLVDDGIPVMLIEESIELS